MPVFDLRNPKAEPQYAAGSRNPEALAQHERNKLSTTAYTCAAIRGYLLATVEPANLLQFANHILAENQSWAAVHSTVRPTHRDVAAMQAELDALVPRHAAALTAEIEALDDSRLIPLIVWARMQGAIEGEPPGTMPDMLMKLTSVQDWLRDFSRALDCYSDVWMRPMRLTPLNFASYGPRTAGRAQWAALAADPHPVLKLWTMAVNAAQLVPISFGATDMRNAWRIV